MIREDKQAIVKKLSDTLVLTREDIVDLKYYVSDSGSEFVDVFYENGFKKTANVSMDSGIALIRDVLKICSDWDW